MKLSEHFTLQEFVRSDKARAKGIDNSLPPQMLTEAQNTAAMMERIRAHLGGVPILVTSGYRCPQLNRAVGGAAGSDHVQAMAVDFKAPAYGTPFEIARELARYVDELEIGQLIHECPGGVWVHVSTRQPERSINRVITITAAGTVGGIVPA